MIYFLKDRLNEMLTDNWRTDNPVSVKVLIDDTEIGTFDNHSIDAKVIALEIPGQLFDNIEAREYILKLYSGTTLIKEELCKVKLPEGAQPIQQDNQMSLIMYENN